MRTSSSFWQPARSEASTAKVTAKKPSLPCFKEHLIYWKENSSAGYFSVSRGGGGVNLGIHRKGGTQVGFNGQAFQNTGGGPLDSFPHHTPSVAQKDSLFKEKNPACGFSAPNAPANAHLQAARHAGFSGVMPS